MKEKKKENVFRDQPARTSNTTLKKKKKEKKNVIKRNARDYLYANKREKRANDMRVEKKKTPTLHAVKLISQPGDKKKKIEQSTKCTHLVEERKQKKELIK